MVSTRKRSAAADEPLAQLAPAKRTRKSGPTAPSPARGLLGSPRASSPPASAAKAASGAVPKKGSRGAAYLAAAGSKAAAASPARAATKKQAGRAKEAVQQLAEPAVSAAAAPPPLPPPEAQPSPAGAKPRNPLLRQELPGKLATLADMFAGLQTVYEVMKRRGQRITYQSVRAAVEEASGRRFLLPHVYQLKQLLPEALELEWVRLPVAAHSSRTEPALSLALHATAAAAAAAAEGAAPRGGGELQAARQLLHCRLAAHLMGNYRQHLDARRAALRSAGDEAGLAAVEAAAAAAAAQPLPLARFLAPFPEGVADVPQQAPPPLPTPARGGSPSVLVGNAAAAAAQAALPLTPASSKPQLPASTTGRTGRPPVHPSAANRHQQRRLSFSAAAAAAASRASKPDTPLDKLSAQLDSAAQQEQQQQQEAGGSAAAAVARQLHPAQAALAAALSPADLASFGGSVPSEAEAQAERAAEEARLLASMPEQLRRYSSQGIVSIETLKALEASDQQARRLSSAEAVAAREASAALGELPKMFPRLQRIFGMQGPVALKMRDVVLRIKQGGCETSTLAHIEASLRALAEHAPEYLTIKPYGSSDPAPALWINRRINPNAIMARLQGVADARHAQRASATAGIV